MRAAQQLLFPDPKPLVERLGTDFFRQLPRSPGVYFMRDASDTVLYVGKAKCLRHRLASYRVANPERMPRRTLRLLRLVERIVWEECPDETAALRRESELLLELKPRFNRAGVWRGPRRFLAWRVLPEGLALSVAEAPPDDSDRVGPFGAHATYLRRSLLRLLWCRLRPDRGLTGMPAGWFRGRQSDEIVIPHSDPALLEESRTALNALAGGRPDCFQQWLRPPANPFEQLSREEDLDFVTNHFARVLPEPS